MNLSANEMMKWFDEEHETVKVFRCADCRYGIFDPYDKIYNCNVDVEDIGTDLYCLVGQINNEKVKSK